MTPLKYKDLGKAAKFKKQLEEMMRKFQDFIEKMKDKENGNDSVEGLRPHVSSFYH